MGRSPGRGLPCWVGHGLRRMGVPRWLFIPARGRSGAVVNLGNVARGALRAPHHPAGWCCAPGQRGSFTGKGVAVQREARLAAHSRSQVEAVPALRRLGRGATRCGWGATRRPTLDPSPLRVSGVRPATHTGPTQTSRARGAYPGRWKVDRQYCYAVVFRWPKVARPVRPRPRRTAVEGSGTGWSCVALPPKSSNW